MNSKKVPTICLNMIVKNENQIITRLFDSILPIINTYCICDTGSTDNTLDIIKDYFETHNIPGKIIKEPFKNFEYNRTYSLKQCSNMADYILLMDADMVLHIDKFDKSMLFNADIFNIQQGNTDFYYQNTRIIKSSIACKYIGVTHEYLSIENKCNLKTITLDPDVLFINDIGDGGSKTNKFKRDILLLTEGIKDDPNNARYHFYLANSYKDIQDYNNAILYYKKRILLGEFYQEIWFSYYAIGNIYEILNKYENALFYWMKAYNHTPIRLENIYKIVRYYRIHSEYQSALLFYNIAKKILNDDIIDIHKTKNNFLFLLNDIYLYKFNYEYSIISCYLNGDKPINEHIIKILNYSNDTSIITNLKSNMKFYKHIIQPLFKIDMTSTYTNNINNTPMQFFSSSPCIIQNYNNTKYLINIRFVNYSINSKGKYLVNDSNNKVITINKYVEMSKDFEILKEKYFETDIQLYNNQSVLGIEDIRLFLKQDSETPVFLSSFQHKQNINIGYGMYNVNNNMLQINKIQPSFCNNTCEKNWTFFNYKNDTHIIYDWYPIQICKINHETNMLNVIETNSNIPNIFKNIRGSTSGVKYNNEYWFLVHMVSYESPRWYYNMFCVFDLNMKLLKYSPPFKLQEQCIEYVLGLIVEKKTIILSYSVLDNTSIIGVYDKNYINNILVNYLE